MGHGINFILSHVPPWKRFAAPFCKQLIRAKKMREMRTFSFLFIVETIASMLRYNNLNEQCWRQS